MRKYLLVFAAALLVVSMAVPALADVQFLYGGQFRFRINAADNVFDGTDHAGYYGNFAPQSPDAAGKANSYYNSNDNRFYLDQRLRLYFTFVGSKNLKVVTKFEIGDTKWGDPGDFAGLVGGRTGQNGGGNVGADEVAIEVKNAYIEFNIPNTPSTAIIGVQTLTLLDSWIVDDDFSAAVLVTKLDPFRVVIGYVGGQYGAERRFGSASPPLTVASANGSHDFMSYSNQDANVDSAFLAVDYTCAPWKASFVTFYQNGHKSNVSIDPTTLSTPVSAYTGISDTGIMPTQINIKSNDLWDLGFNLTYKVDWLLAYVNFVKNLGSVDYINPVNLATLGNPNPAVAPGSGVGVLGPATKATGPFLGSITSSAYTGWMIDAGFTYFCPPWTFNLNGFYLSGPSFSDTVGNQGVTANANTVNTAGQIVPGVNPATSTLGGAPIRGTTSTDVEWFTYPLATAKYTSEIIGGGVLMDDMHPVRGYANGLNSSSINLGGPGGLSTVYWRGYYFPTNLWTITAGTSYQVCPGTKLSFSYWYWGTSESVPVAFDSASFAAAGVNTNPASAGYGTVANPNALKYKMSSDIGHELNFYLDQQIVDNLTLTFVAAYLIADDAFCPTPISTLPAGEYFGKASTQVNPNLYTSPAAENAWKLGARIQWNF